MGAISKLIGAGLKKAAKKTTKKKVAVKGLGSKKKSEYSQKSVNQMEAEVKQAKEMLKKGSSRPDHHKNIIKKLEKAITAEKGKRSMHKFEKAFNKTSKADNTKPIEKRITKAKRMVEAGAGKRKKVKQGKKSPETTEELLKKASKMPTFKKQVD